MVSKVHLRLSRWVTIVVCCLAWSIQVLAQTIQVVAPREYAAGRPFNITYTVSSRDEASVVSEPQLSGLELLYGPAIGTSSSYNYVNGRVSSSSRTEVTYTVLANNEGKYTVSGFKLRLGDKVLSAQATTITIRGGQSGSANHTWGQGGEETSRANLHNEQAQYKYYAQVPRKSVYVQEALPIVYKLQATEQPNINSTKPSTYDGFVSLDLLGNSPRQLRLERIGGRDWVTVEVMKELLFAQHAGQLTIPANELPVLYTLRDPGGDPFLNRTAERILRTEPLTITVKPLPEEGKPQDFSGAVGSFNVRYEVSTTQWKTNEAVSLKLILEGQGNLKIAKLPKISLPTDIEIYDPVENSNQSYEGGVLRSTRVIEYSLIPRNTGSFTIPSVSLSYFNPSTGRYETTATRAIDINVTQGKQQAGETTIVNSGTVQNDKTPYNLKTDVLEHSPYAPMSLRLILLHLGLLLVAFVVYRLLRRRHMERADVLGYAEKRANTVAIKRLTVAQKYLNEGKRDAFLEEVLQALWGYLGDKLKLPTSELSRDNIREHLSTRGIPEEVISRLRTVIDDVEFARFAPSNQSIALDSLYQQAVEAITSIETSKTK